MNQANNGIEFPYDTFITTYIAFTYLSTNIKILNDTGD